MKLFYLSYFILCFLLLILVELLKDILKVDKLLYTSLSEQLTPVQLENLFNVQKKWQWIGYIFIPIYMLSKISIIASVLYIGIFFFTKNEIFFKDILKIVVLAEFIFLLIPICKIIWFYFLKTNYTLDDAQNFYPLSALNITGYQGLERWLIYPLQVLNFFELAYIIYLSYQIGKLTQTSTDNGFKIVGYSYVPALFLWVAVVMFFTLNYS